MSVLDIFKNRSDWWEPYGDWWEQIDRVPVTVGDAALKRRVLEAARNPDDFAARFALSVELREVLSDAVKDHLGTPYTLWLYDSVDPPRVCLGLLPTTQAAYRCFLFEARTGLPLTLIREVRPLHPSLSRELLVKFYQLPTVATDPTDSAERLWRDWTLAAVMEAGAAYEHYWFREDAGLRDMRKTRTAKEPTSWEGWDRVFGLVTPNYSIYRMTAHREHGQAILWVSLGGRWSGAALKHAMATANALLPNRHVWVGKCGTAWLATYCGDLSEDGKLTDEVEEQAVVVLQRTKAVLLRADCFRRGAIVEPVASSAAVPQPSQPVPVLSLIKAKYQTPLDAPDAEWVDLWRDDFASFMSYQTYELREFTGIDFRDSASSVAQVQHLESVAWPPTGFKRPYEFDFTADQKKEPDGSDTTT